ncbi:MAG: tetratricopeptide repeat protein, partial [Acidobacteriota bacterium]
GRGPFRAAQISALATEGEGGPETAPADDRADFARWLDSLASGEPLAVVTPDGDLLPHTLRSALRHASEAGSVAWIDGSPAAAAAKVAPRFDEETATLLDEAARASARSQAPGEEIEAADLQGEGTAGGAEEVGGSALAPNDEKSRDDASRAAEILAERAVSALLLLDAPAGLDLLIAALNGSGPLDPDEVMDLVDDFFVDELGILEDLGFLHPAFEDSAYRVADPAKLHRWRETRAPGEIEKLAEFWLAWLRRALPARQRTTSLLLLRLSDLAFGSGDPRSARLRRRLAWWDEDLASVEEEARAQLETAALDGRDLLEIGGDQALPPGVRLLFLALLSERGAPDEDLGACRMSSALALAEADRHEEALKAAREAVRWHAERDGPGEGERVALYRARWLFAQLLGAAGQQREARDELAEVYRASRVIFEETDPRRGGAAAALGDSHLKLGELRKALEPLREAARLAELTRGAGHPQTLVRRSNLAKLLIDTGEHEEAHELLRRTLAEADEGLSPRRILFPVFHNLQALSLRLCGEDRSELERLLAESQRLFGDHADQIQLLTRLAELAGRDGEENLVQTLEARARELAESQRMPGFDQGIADLLEAAAAASTEPGGAG